MILVPCVFVADVAIVHDLMHQNLGVSRRTNSILLGVLAMLMLDSGHALQATHNAHHRLFPSEDDPEAYLAAWPVWRVLSEGPCYRYRLWVWAWRHQRDRRTTIVIEAGAHFALLGVATHGLLAHQHLGLSTYVAVGLLGSWLFPLISLTTVHDTGGRTQFQQSKTIRGTVVPRLLLGMGYHLEHHLWPRIPSHHLAATAERSDQLLAQHGASITKVP